MHTEMDMNVSNNSMSMGMKTIQNSTKQMTDFFLSLSLSSAMFYLIGNQNDQTVQMETRNNKCKGKMNKMTKKNG